MDVVLEMEKRGSRSGSRAAKLDLSLFVSIRFGKPSYE